MSQAIFGQSTDFTYQSDTNACLPIDVQFTQTSGGQPVGYLWDFGNGTRSNSANPIATYTSAGYYTVRLITVYANNTAQKTKTIVVHSAISATFSSDINTMCRPGTVNFTASNSGNLGSYTWDFGDGTPLLTGTANVVPHTYTAFGEFTVTLTATSVNGCAVNSSRTIKVQRPVITGSITSPLMGCIPMTTDFNSSVQVMAGSNVNSYTWDFGDGNILNTSTPGTAHIYNQAGSYSPTLTITTNEGCTNTFRFDSVAYGRPPTNNNAYPLDTIFCGSEIPQFVSYTATANRYDWDFGGGSITSLTDTLAEHRYSTLGYKNINVTPVNNGCPGTPTAFRINIIGVIARFSYSNTCTDKKTFEFNNTSQGNISTISWNLGNQAYSSNMQSVTHTYPQSGVFGVKLLITDNITGCVDSFKTKIYTANPVLNNPDVSICINTDTHFTISNNYLNPALSYLWDVLGNVVGPGTESSPVAHADSLGHFTNNVILINGPQYCPDTIQLDHPITVRGPKLDFTAPTSLCLNASLNVINLSVPFQAADTITSWAWNFGRPEYNDNNFQPQPFNYSFARGYNVKLTATDKYGCQDSLVKRLTVRPTPFLWIIPKLDTLCQGQNSTLIGYTSDNILWTPASTNFCTTCDTTMVSPVETTKFYATSTNSFNCTATDSAMVKVFKPFTARPLTPDSSMCSGGKITLDVEPRNKAVVWSPERGLSNSHVYAPDANATRTTLYTATLTDSAGCFSSNASIQVTINPLPGIDAGADKVLAYHTDFMLNAAYTPNVKTWLWAPADSLSCSTCANPTGNATSTTTYSVTVTSDSGCVARDEITVFVECKGANLLMPNAFTPNNDGQNDFYRPITRGIKHINRFAIFNRQGELVYEESNFSPNKESSGGWDGKFKGKDASPAAYVYVIEAVCDLGQNLYSKGSFILIR